MRQMGIEGCAAVPVRGNVDARGCLFEIFREEWAGAFKTVQWNACVSRAGVMRGVHVHVDYAEFYTLPMGRAHVGLIDIRRESPTFRRSESFEWSAGDGFAIVVPAGVAHAVYFLEPSALVFGLSGYWRPDVDMVGCAWSEPALGFEWPVETASLSARDAASGSFEDMLESFEQLRAIASLDGFRLSSER